MEAVVARCTCQSWPGSWAVAEESLLTTKQLNGVEPVVHRQAGYSWLKLFKKNGRVMTATRASLIYLCVILIFTVFSSSFMYPIFWVCVCLFAVVRGMQLCKSEEQCLQYNYRAPIYNYFRAAASIHCPNPLVQTGPLSPYCQPHHPAHIPCAHALNWPKLIINPPSYSQDPRLMGVGVCAEIFILFLVVGCGLLGWPVHTLEKGSIATQNK